MRAAGDGGTPADRETPENATGITHKRVSHSGVMSKKLANKIAAAKFYEAAMKNAGEEVPESVGRQARRAN